MAANGASFGLFIECAKNRGESGTCSAVRSTSGPRAEQTAGQPSRVNDSDPAKDGVDDVAQRPAVDRDPRLERDADRVEKTGVEMPAGFGERFTRAKTTKEVPHVHAVVVPFPFVPRDAEIE